MLENKPYWIELDNVLHLQGEDGQLNSSASYWHDFPLSLANIPTEEDKNTVLSSRTLLLSALAHDGLIAIDEDNTTWVKVTALDKQSLMIHGWVNIKDNAQAHIKRCSPWHWPGFETIEEKASIGELSNKIGKNKVAKLYLEDYTPAMQELHQILTGTLRYSNQRKKTHLPSFTNNYLKEGLRRSWVAERIGHLLVKYESEWYADEALSKWNEIDELFEEEQQQKALIEAELDKIGITEPYQRNFAMKKLNEAHEHVKSNWQLEKEERIKPSLWWKKVAQAQTQNSTANTEANTPKLSNLSADGKAWFIHPVAMMDYFNVETTKLWHEPLEYPQRTVIVQTTILISGMVLLVI
ncbi:hypothetical protein A9G35_01480 [Gilliamella sp. Choc5-1]|uniref:hypothetical protein n=1 Tax=Gilliamella sp. Choc5-1 TaxID=3120238 RepID=UPI00080E1B99|nr:hypothetical protein [Gilliamella apicola]OCG48522.1 hypothetical protein A9G35_01480 [Gilliamella apicola]